MKDRLGPRLQLLGHHRLRDPIGHGGHTQHSGARPCAFAISTARTGGGKYEPDDMRFQTLYRLPFRSCSNAASDSPSTPAAPRFAFTR